MSSPLPMASGISSLHHTIRHQTAYRESCSVIQGRHETQATCTIATVLDAMARKILAKTTTNRSPAEMLLRRRPNSRLDLIRPSTRSRVERKQKKQKQQHDQHAKDHTFNPGDRVLVRNFASGPTWLPGELLQRTGPVSFTAQLSDGRVVRRHQDHILSCTCNQPISELVAPPTRMEHRILPDIPTTSEPTNVEAQLTDTVESPVKSTQPVPTVELDSACVPTTPE